MVQQHGGRSEHAHAYEGGTTLCKPLELQATLHLRLDGQWSHFDVAISLRRLLIGVGLLLLVDLSKFEELNLKLFQKTLGPIKTVLEDADLKKDQARAKAKNVILQGGF